MRIEAAIVSGTKLWLGMKLPKTKPRSFRGSQAAFRKWRSSRAHILVSYAMRVGLLPRLDGSTQCSDCDQPAHVYDHRDYSRPLNVEPVCTTCNLRRGMAVNEQRKRRRYEGNTICVRLDDELMKTVREVAWNAHMTMKGFVGRALANEIDRMNRMIHDDRTKEINQ